MQIHENKTTITFIYYKYPVYYHELSPKLCNPLLGNIAVEQHVLPMVLHACLLPGYTPTLALIISFRLDR
jgi:hypothetical protein